MLSWIFVWRKGIAPHLTTGELLALRDGLERNAGILQKTTTFPPALQCLAQHPVEKACALAFALWQGRGLTTVAEVQEAFADLCHQVGETLGDPVAVRWFLNHVDEADRTTMRQELLAEVNRVLGERAWGQAHKKEKDQDR